MRRSRMGHLHQIPKAGRRRIAERRQLPHQEDVCRGREPFCLGLPMGNRDVLPARKLRNGIEAAEGGNHFAGAFQMLHTHKVV